MTMRRPMTDEQMRVLLMLLVGGGTLEIRHLDGRTVKGLVKRGLVAYSNGRIYVTLTPAGRELADAAS